MINEKKFIRIMDINVITETNDAMPSDRHNCGVSVPQHTEIPLYMVLIRLLAVLHLFNVKLIVFLVLKNNKG